MIIFNLSMTDLSVKFMEQKFIRISRVETIRLGLAKYIKYYIHVYMI